MKTMTRKQRIEAEAHERYVAANWPLMLGGNLGIAAKLREVEDRGGHWIHTNVR